MRVLVQRVSNASVTVDNNIVGSINEGLLCFVGFTHDDNKDIIDWMIKKILNLRIFEDENGKMNLSVGDMKGELLLVSQFTLYANPMEGNRPSFTNAMNAKEANELFKYFVNKTKECPLKVESGIFQADMKVNLLNNGPVTIWIDSKEK